ncbi:MAG: T9SS type A sorting domain-containing protein, partial [Bacteroidetes bacterium]|nr:T9SS type A sorting domain-containing protein [Bacteroidota bacterium]
QFLKTTDGGTTWQTGTINTTISRWFDIQMKSTDTIFVVGEKQSIASSFDAGISWDIIFSTDGSNVNLRSLCFPGNEALPFVVGDSGVCYSVEHYSGYSYLSEANISPHVDLDEISLYNDSCAYLLGEDQSGNSVCFITFPTKYYRRFKQIFLPSDFYSLSSICFLDSAIGYASGYPGIMAHTSNGGHETILNAGIDLSRQCRDSISLAPQINNSWEYVGTVPTTEGFPDETVLYHSGITNAKWFSNVNAIAFSPVWAQLSAGGGRSRTILMQTYDGGVTWDSTTYLPFEVYDICFTNNQTGFACGFDDDEFGYISRTNDAGQTWSTANIGVVPALVSIWFSDSLIGFCGGVLGTMLKTTDGGLTWNNINTGVSDVIMDIVPLNADTILVGGASDAGTTFILMSGNEGISWISINPPNTDDYIMGLFVLDQSRVILVPEFGEEMFFTYDMGLSWSTISVPNTILPFGYNSIAALDNDIAFLGCGNGRIRSTYNAGQTWQFEIFETNDDIDCIFLNTIEQVYAFSDKNLYKRGAQNTFQWSPPTGLSNPNISNPTASPEQTTTYTVSVTTPEGCVLQDSVTISVVPKARPTICLVSVDTVDWKNKVMWEPSSEAGCSEYNIYKETGTNVYSLLGTVDASDPGEFIDYTSVPEAHGDRYKISLMDSCDLETEKSFYHNTMNLTIAAYGSTMGLSWSAYIDESGNYTPLRYYIYRGGTPLSMQLLDSVSGTQHSYNDNNVFQIYYYMIGVQKDPPCDVYGNGRSFSNKKDNASLVGLQNAAFCPNLTVSPNPFTSQTTISFEKPITEYRILITDVTGKVVFEDKNASGEKYVLQRGTLERGMYLLEITNEEFRMTRKLVIN